MAVSHWDWSKSNGTATVDKTVATYNALTTGGLTSAFSASVWNDILSKISAQRIAWGDTAWNNKIAKLADSQMSAGKQMTAVKFNSAVLNIPISNYAWPWEEKLGRSEILKGDRCYGMYFIHLTDGINHWIDLVPLPIDVVAAFHTLNQANVDILKALHVLPAKPVPHSVLSSVTVGVPASVPIHAEHTAFQTGRALVSFLRNLEVRIAHFMRSRSALNVSMYPTEHVIFSDNIAVKSSVSMSFNNTLYFLVALKIALEQRGKLESVPSFPFYINSRIGSMTGEATLSARQLLDLAFDLDVSFKSEPWIKEVYANPLRAVLDIPTQTRARISFNDTRTIEALLDVIVSGYVNVKPVSAKNIAALAQFLTPLEAKLCTKRAQRISAALLESSTLLSRLTTQRVLPFAEFDLDVSFKNELRIKESYAEHLRVALDIPTQMEAKISYNDTCAVEAPLDIIVSEYVKVRPAPAEHVMALARFLTPIGAKLHADKAQGIEVALLGSSTLLSRLTTQHVLPFAAYDLSDFNFSADMTIRPGINAAGFAGCRYDVNVTISEMEGKPTGTTLNMRVLVGAVVDVFNSPHTGSMLKDCFNMQVDAAVCRGVASGAKLYDQFHTRGKSFLTVPAYFSAEFSYQSEMDVCGTLSKLESHHTTADLTIKSAEQCTVVLSRFICLSAASSSSYTGKATLTAREQLPIFVYSSFTHDGIATLNAAPLERVSFTLPIKCNMTLSARTANAVCTSSRIYMTHSGAVKLYTIGLTLATELEDMLASDLDNMLVTKIEIMF